MKGIYGIFCLLVLIIYLDICEILKEEHIPTNIQKISRAVCVVSVMKKYTMSAAYRVLWDALPCQMIINMGFSWLFWFFFPDFPDFFHVTQTHRQLLFKSQGEPIPKAKQHTKRRQFLSPDSVLAAGNLSQLWNYYCLHYNVYNVYMYYCIHNNEKLWKQSSSLIVLESSFQKKFWIHSFGFHCN